MFDISSPVFALIREGAHPSGLDDLKLQVVIDLLADIPTFGANLSSFQNQPAVGRLQFGVPGGGTHLEPDGTRITLDPNDFGIIGDRPRLFRDKMTRMIRMIKKTSVPRCRAAHV